ncbi:MAG: serine/threonine-protein kinase [Candidatus Saganbacteria bacterium]|nr:serine/threonine-protein kinase [Candidatus Saganbacteria bacterium]
MERILKSKYKILEKIAELSSHNTYSGAFADTEKPLIIKIFNRGILNSTLTKKLKKDVVRLTKLEHQFIPRVYDGDYGWQGFYFVRDFVEGKTLDETKKPFEIEAACELMTKVCGLLSFAHENGIAHGSLTPNNVFISKKNVFISDFGIESAVNQMLEQKTMSLFSENAAFFAPEMVLGEEASILSDIYQAGLLFYLILTGRLPADGQKGLSSALTSLGGTVPTPSSVNGKVPRYLDEIVLKCLEKDPLLRFAGAAQLSESINNKVLMLPKTEIFELPEIDLNIEEESRKDEPVLVELPNIEEKSDKINLFRWIMFAVWAAIAAGIIYSLIQIFIIGE